MPIRDRDCVARQDTLPLAGHVVHKTHAVQLAMPTPRRCSLTPPRPDRP